MSNGVVAVLSDSELDESVSEDACETRRRLATDMGLDTVARTWQLITVAVTKRRKP